MTAHFTATLEVTRTTPPAPSPTGSFDRRITTEPKTTDRAVDNLARIVVRADTLTALTTKLAAHVALIEE